MTTIVTGVLEKSCSLLVEGVWPELKSFLGFQKEVRKLESTLRAIQAVLEDADKRQLQEEAVNLWLDKLKEAAYDVDNVLDELDTAIIKAKIEEEEEKAETTTATAKVWACISCLSSPFTKIKELVSRHGIVQEIKKLNETLDEIAKEKDRYSFVFGSGSSSSTNIEIGKRPETISKVDVSDIIGREMYSDDLVRNLLGEDSGENKRNPCVISLVGMGGIGKTALAQLAYNDDKVKSHFEIRMWVCVSEPFDISSVARAIIQEIKPTPLDNNIRLETLVKNIEDLTQGKRFFLVLDDVWTEENTKWENLKLALNCGAQGSSILVTTRSERVANMVHSDPTISLDALSEDDCWLIFSKIAFFGENKFQRDQLTDLGRKLVKRCKGLPLAAKTLGSLMYNKRSRKDWRDILDSNLWELENVQEGLLGPLLLSYYEQPSAIKSCFLYCALFPKDYLFSRNELIYLWMSQGYLGINPNIEMENIGEEYFEILVMRSFFQDFEKDKYDDKIVKCKMHDIVHDFAQLMASKECFTIDGDKELGTNCKSVRHLRIGKTQFPLSMYNAKNVRTLFFPKLEWRTVFPLNLFQHLTCLRALTLKSYSFENLPNEVEKLIHLRLLDLSGNRNIKELPETMCNLCNLQTLNISECPEITKLPQSMGKLKKLRHLVAGQNSSSGSGLTQPFPKGIGRLSSLRTLEKFIIGGIDDIDGCKLGQLKNLVHLKGSLEISGLENVTDVQEAENAELKKKIHLRELRLRFGGEAENRRGENDELVLNALEPHPELESLSVHYYGGTVYPIWLMSLTILKKLELGEWDKLEHLPPLGKLGFLESLKIEGALRVKKVGVEFLGIEEESNNNNKIDDEKGSTSSSSSSSSLVLFPNLKRLEFWRLREWEEWDGIGGTMREEEAQESGVTITIMPSLRELEIFNCPMLKSLPDFLPTTPLKTLFISFSPILSKCCKTKIGDQWPKISHIPNISTDFA